VIGNKITNKMGTKSKKTNIINKDRELANENIKSTKTPGTKF
jgi:antitoxin component HigA of HigAB toxin-antitoxin module